MVHGGYTAIPTKFPTPKKTIQVALNPLCVHTIHGLTLLLGMPPQVLNLVSAGTSEPIFEFCLVIHYIMLPEKTL